MLITPPFVVRKPTGIDFIQQLLQPQFRDHLKEKRRALTAAQAKVAAAATDASSVSG